MTVSEFETLRSDLAAFRREVTTEISAVRADVAGVNTEFATLRAVVSAKPDTSTIYQAVLAIVAATFAMVVGTTVLLKSVGTIL